MSQARANGGGLEIFLAQDRATHSTCVRTINIAAPFPHLKTITRAGVYAVSGDGALLARSGTLVAVGCDAQGEASAALAASYVAIGTITDAYVLLSNPARSARADLTIEFVAATPLRPGNMVSLALPRFTFSGSGGGGGGGSVRSVECVFREPFGVAVREATWTNSSARLNVTLATDLAPAGAVSLTCFNFTNPPIQMSSSTGTISVRCCSSLRH